MALKWSRFVLVICVVVFAGIVQAQDNVIQFPSGVNLTSLTSVNSGSKDSGTLPSEGGDTGYICIGSTAYSKGAHLGSAAAALTTSGASQQALQSLMSNTKTDVFTSQVAFKTNSSGQSLWSNALYPYLDYFNGTVMSQRGNKPFKVYLIFYGKSWTAANRQAVKKFVDSLSQPDADICKHTVGNWWKINTMWYYDTKNRHVTADVEFNGSYTDTGSAYPKGSYYGGYLSDRDIRYIVVNAIKKNNWVYDTRSVFSVFLDANTYANDMCMQYCSYHSSFRAMKKTLAYIVVQDPSVQCPGYCSYQYFDQFYQAKNGLGVDASINWFAHGLSGVATNPFQARRGNRGWVVADSTIDNADMCEWDFGYVKREDQCTYNLKGHDGTPYLVQRLWNRNQKRCAMTACKTAETQNFSS